MKDDRIYLLHIRDAVQLILDYTTAGQEGFFADRKTQDAVVRNLEIIGEQRSAYLNRSRTLIPISLGDQSPECETS